jgi:hypothetical protein
MMPAAANKLGKKYGAQVGQETMYEGGPEKWLTDLFPPAPVHQGNSHTVHTLPITPALREQALRKGFPLYVTGGATTMGALAAQDRYNREQ